MSVEIVDVASSVAVETSVSCTVVLTVVAMVSIEFDVMIVEMVCVAGSSAALLHPELMALSG